MSLEIEVLGKAMSGKLDDVDKKSLRNPEIRDTLTAYFAERESRPEVIVAIKVPSLMGEYLGLRLEDRVKFAEFIEIGKEYLEGKAITGGKKPYVSIDHSIGLINLAKKMRMTNQLLAFFDFYLQNSADGQKFDFTYLRNDTKLLEHFGRLSIRFIYSEARKRESSGFEVILSYAAQIKPEITHYAKLPHQNKPIGWLEDINVTIDEIKKIKDECGSKTIPPAYKLRSLGHHSLVMAIHRHGGFRKMRKLMGESQLKSEDGLWKNRDYVFVQLDEVMEKEGWKSLPSGRCLQRKGYSGLRNAIMAHGGMRHFRDLLGQKQLRKRMNYWKEWDNVEKELSEEIDKNDGRFPARSYFNKNHKGSLLVALGKYHGGVEAVRKRLMSGGKNES